MRPAEAPPLWLPPEADVPAQNPLNVWGPCVTLGIMILTFAIGFAWLSLLRHQAFQSHAFDLGNVDQAVWNTVHGHPLRFTDMALGHRVLTTRLAIHVEPVLVLVALLYLAHSGPETLLILQAAIVALGAIPAYLLARAALPKPWLSLVFPAAYLLHPSLENAVLDDFHAVALSSTFLLAALYCAYRSFVPGFALFAILAASTKEEIGLLVAMLGFVLIWRRQWSAGFMSLVAGVGWFLTCVLLIIPGFNPGGGSPYISRYRYLGHGMGGIVSGILVHPHTVLRVLTSTSRLAYLDRLLHPLGFLPLLNVPGLLLALPALLINMLSSDPRMYSGFYQYSAEIVPFVIGAAAIGAGFWSRFAVERSIWRSAWLPVAICSVVLLAGIVDSRQLGFSPLAEGYVVPASGSHQILESKIIARIPGQASVAAADEIEPHLSDRFWIYKLPTLKPRNGPAPKYVVLDASIPGLPVTPRRLHSVAVTALHHGYGVERGSDGILLLEKRLRRKSLPRSFFSFMFRRSGRVAPESARWGSVRLVGLTVHPVSGSVNASRPAITVESYWRAKRHLSSHLRIAFYLSPIYDSTRPRFSPLWQKETDSPTWDWLPPSRWPSAHEIRASSLPMTPSELKSGKVDVAIGVAGAGSAKNIGPDKRMVGAKELVRVATIRVEG